MRELARRAESLLLRHEMAFALAMITALFLSIPLFHGTVELGWDALNHQIYLGWTAERHRFGIDHLAAGHQSLTYPYLYWPAYKLAAVGASGLAAGIVLGLLQALIAIPAWLLARACMPGDTGFDAAMRLLAVLLSMMTSVILLLVNTTGNDVLAAVPMLLAMALAVAPMDKARPAWMTVRRAVVLSGVMAGLAAAAKLSNGPIAILLPGLWLLHGTGWGGRIRIAALGCIATLAAFFAAYGYWGALLWKYYGNPVYPMFDNHFAPLRAMAGWQP